MSAIYLLALAILQGITEFLPVSSSAHLELLHQYNGQTTDDLALDVAVHLGTLGAVILYFWKDVKRGLQGVVDLIFGRFSTNDAALAKALILATIPVVIAGLILKVSGGAEMLRSLHVIGWAMILFGILLWWADRNPIAVKTAADWNTPDAIKLGLWQAVALIPGTSRSGITITGALKMGYSRTDAARISMLMSIPTIIASGVLIGADAAATANAALIKPALIAATFSFVAALVALMLMMRLLKTVSFTPYVIYRVILGAVLLWFAYN